MDGETNDVQVLPGRVLQRFQMAGAEPSRDQFLAKLEGTEAAVINVSPQEKRPHNFH